MRVSALASAETRDLQRKYTALNGQPIQLQPGLLPGPRLCAICPSVRVLTEPGAYRERAPHSWPQPRELWRHQGGTFNMPPDLAVLEDQH